MSKFVNRVVGRMPPEEEVREAEVVRDPAPASPALSRLAGYTGAADQKQDDGRQVATPLADGDPVERAKDYAELGEHVASVLETATVAAAKIRDDARDDARKVAERTNKKAAEVVETARLEAKEVSANSKQLLAEVEEETRESRQRANDYLAERREEAETEASRILAGAKREASMHTRAAQERRTALDKNVALTEERLRQLVGGLHDLAGRLEELLGGQAPIRTEEATDTAPSPSLDAALRPSAADQTTEQLT